MVASLSILAMIVLGVVITLLVSKILSKTILKGMPSSFALELPPYRRPQIGRIIVRSLYDRTLFVLSRAIIVAAPAGMITWAFANITSGDISILQHSAKLLDPLAHLLGMDGFILMAFMLGLPANEIVLPDSDHVLYVCRPDDRTGQPAGPARPLCCEWMDLADGSLYDVV